MILSHANRYIFIKARKAASSSIQKALAADCRPGDIVTWGRWSRGDPPPAIRSPHALPADVRRYVGGESWSQYFTFTFVRNPFDVVVSRYHWNLAGRNCSIAGFRAWLPGYLETQQVVEGYRGDLQHQYAFIDGVRVVDFIGRYESLERDFADVLKRLGLPPRPLGNEKRGFRPSRDWRSFYSDEGLRQVAEHFRADFELLDYELPHF